ncbi:MAG: hypothetical protein AMDU1_APLC00027G0006 [Thermoplasmatales archaeon A-plasma]|jgi:metal-responsive CopG/Arc/MetJ family transcriptional regulator|nr:MAG: hypothetical protein AMDU1_APLC00027G0006 [Thermoplasmatales archaeon A-plasma]
MAKEDWQTVGLPKELLDLIDHIIEEGKLGYTSKSEFIKEAIRERILKLKEAGLADI